MTNMLINNLAYRQMCCSSCGVVYFFPDKWCDQARVEGKSWKCPNGHGQWFGEAEVDKLRRERDRLKQQVAQRDDEVSRQRDMRQGVERRLNATRGVVTRIKNRVGHGVCPCCTRSFGNLASHMKNQHPDYAKAPVLEAAE